MFYVKDSHWPKRFQLDLPEQIPKENIINSLQPTSGVQHFLEWSPYQAR